jgi:transketolase
MPAPRCSPQMTPAWHRYVGLDGKIIALERFGLSAPGGTALKALGITAEAVVKAVKAL